MMNGIVFDLDGTLYLGTEAVAGALAGVSALKKQGSRIFYLTNNSGKSRQQIIQKLNTMGFGASTDNVYCGSYAVARYLAQNNITPVYVIGTEAFARELASHGISIEKTSAVTAVVVGLDPLFDYHKITVAMDAIENGAKLIVANTDPSYPVENNRRLPGCGAIVAALVAATCHTPDFHVGKPNTYLLELLCKEQGFSPKEIYVVGDGPESDIAMADRFGCRSVLFDAKGAFPEFNGGRAEKFHEIVSLIIKGG